MTSPALAEITRLSVSERIQLVEDIWDTIVADPDTMALTEPQKMELERRISAFQQGHDVGASWDEVRKRVLDK